MVVRRDADVAAFSEFVAARSEDCSVRRTW
jgi:hypothetical protein